MTRARHNTAWQCCRRRRLFIICDRLILAYWYCCFVLFVLYNVMEQIFSIFLWSNFGAGFRRHSIPCVVKNMRCGVVQSLFLWRQVSVWFRLKSFWQHWVMVITLSLVESFLESEVPHLRLFLVKIMMPLKRWVATENVLTALLGN